MATQMLSLSQPSGNRSAVLCPLARQKAVKAVKERLRAQGLKLALGSVCFLASPPPSLPMRCAWRCKG